jgi:cardiolipin synthase
MNARTLLLDLNLANQLTFLRLLAAPFLVLALLQSRFGVALALFGAAAITDLLDGLTARLLRRATPLGAYLDPAADKVLLTTAFVMLTEYPTLLREIELVRRIPLWLTVLTISRDVFIVAVALIVYLAYGVERFRPTVWGKLTASCEFVTVSAFLLYAALGRDGAVLDVLIYATLALTVFSGLHYLGRTMRMLRERHTAGLGRGGRT